MQNLNQQQFHIAYQTNAFTNIVVVKYRIFGEVSYSIFGESKGVATHRLMTQKNEQRAFKNLETVENWVKKIDCGYWVIINEQTPQYEKLMGRA